MVFWYVWSRIFLQLLHYLLSTLHHRISYRKIGLNSPASRPILAHTPKLPSTATSKKTHCNTPLGEIIGRTLLAFLTLWSLKYPKVEYPFSLIEQCTIGKISNFSDMPLTGFEHDTYRSLPQKSNPNRVGGSNPGHGNFFDVSKCADFFQCVRVTHPCVWLVIGEKESRNFKQNIQ